MNIKTQLKLLGMASAIVLVGCASDSDDDEHMHEASTYQIKVTNITNHQPLTPPAAILHNSSYNAWMLGSMASTELEKLAEGGDTSDLITSANASSNVYATATLGSAPFGPGESVMTTIETHNTDMIQLSLASMLANTNDAFTGVSQLKIDSLMKGESITVMSHAFDAGTEANSETAATMPGPAAGGTGFDSMRDDKDFIAIHPGVVTMDDGLSTSVLDESHRWLGPVAKIVITREN